MQRTVKFVTNIVQFFSQHFVPLDRISSNFLIDVGGHTCQISDLAWSPGLL